MAQHVLQVPMPVSFHAKEPPDVRKTLTLTEAMWIRVVEDKGEPEEHYFPVDRPLEGPDTGIALFMIHLEDISAHNHPEKLFEQQPEAKTLSSEDLEGDLKMYAVTTTCLRSIITTASKQGDTLGTGATKTPGVCPMERCSFKQARIGTLKRQPVPLTAVNKLSIALREEDELKMEQEAEKYQQRLQVIARKSLRDQWLMEGPPSSPDSSGPRSPLWGSKAQEIETHIN
ncbi:hypothetical protein DNTS_004144, partial [Danionella cerebrum]